MLLLSINPIFFLWLLVYLAAIKTESNGLPWLTSPWTYPQRYSTAESFARLLSVQTPSSIFIPGLLPLYISIVPLHSMSFHDYLLLRHSTTFYKLHFLLQPSTRYAPPTRPDRVRFDPRYSHMSALRYNMRVKTFFSSCC